MPRIGMYDFGDDDSTSSSSGVIEQMQRGRTPSVTPAPVPPVAESVEESSSSDDDDDDDEVIDAEASYGYESAEPSPRYAHKEKAQAIPLANQSGSGDSYEEESYEDESVVTEDDDETEDSETYRVVDRNPPAGYSILDMVRNRRHEQNEHNGGESESGLEFFDVDKHTASKNQQQEQTEQESDSEDVEHPAYAQNQEKLLSEPVVKDSSFHTSPEIYEAPDVIYEAEEEEGKMHERDEGKRGGKIEVAVEEEETGEYEEISAEEEGGEQHAPLLSKYHPYDGGDDDGEVGGDIRSSDAFEEEEVVEIESIDDTTVRENSYASGGSADGGTDSGSRVLGKPQTSSRQEEERFMDEHEVNDDTPTTSGQQQQDQPPRQSWASGLFVQKPNKSGNVDEPPLFSQVPVGADNKSIDSLQEVTETIEGNRDADGCTESSSSSRDNVNNNNNNNNKRPATGTEKKSQNGNDANEEFEDELPTPKQGFSSWFVRAQSSRRTIRSSSGNEEMDGLRQHDEEAAMPYPDRDENGRSGNYHSMNNSDSKRSGRCQTLLICCCLTLFVLGGSFGAAYLGTMLALKSDDDDDEIGDITNPADRDTDTTPSPATDKTPTPPPFIFSNPTTPVPTRAPTVATTSPPGPTAPSVTVPPTTTTDTTVPPATAPQGDFFAANNTIGCPDRNIPLELRIIFDSRPAEVGIYLRDTTKSPIWNFETGTFKSFIQLLRENYFMVCLSPGLKYELTITDMEGDGLVSTLVNNNTVYGRYGIFFKNQVVGTYHGNCSVTEATDCGAFCECKYFLETTSTTRECKTLCDGFVGD